MELSLSEIKKNCHPRLDLGSHNVKLKYVIKIKKIIFENWIPAFARTKKETILILSEAEVSRKKHLNYHSKLDLEFHKTKLYLN